MPDSLQTNSKIVAAYRERTVKSAELATTAREMFPSGITHDSQAHVPLWNLCRPSQRISKVGRGW